MYSKYLYVYRVDTSGRGKIKPIKKCLFLYKKQCEKGVKILDCVQHLTFRCYLDLKNSIKSKFTTKAITINYSPITFRDDNLFDIFYCMYVVGSLNASTVVVRWVRQGGIYTPSI